MGSNSLTDPSAVRSNRSGEITRDQTADLKGKLGSVPGCVTLLIMALLFAVAIVTAGKILASSSTIVQVGVVLVIILLTFLIVSWIGGIIAEGRMSHISVEPSPGKVVWNGNQYVAETEGRTLESVTGGMNLQPGDYTFYIVHGTKYLLSAETASMAHQIDTPPSVAEMKAILEKPIDFDPVQSPEKAAQRAAELRQVAEQFQSMDPARLSSADKDAFMALGRSMGQQMTALMAGHTSLQELKPLLAAVEASSRPPLDSEGQAELNRALQQVGVANPSALEANRQGRLAGGQRGAILGDLRTQLFWAIVVLAGGLGLLYLGFTKQDTMAMLAVAGFLLLIELVLLSQVWHDLGDSLSGSARMEQGIVTKYTRSTHSRRSSYTHYYFAVNKLRFEVSSRAYAALLEGRTYRLYYAPNTKKLVNIETA